MGQGSDHPLRRPTRELSIGIESDNEANPRKDPEIAHFHGEPVGLAAQQRIKIQQLTAFALPSHPCSFLRVVNAMAMEEKKRAQALAGILVVQFMDQLCT